MQFDKLSDVKLSDVKLSNAVVSYRRNMHLITEQWRLVSNTTESHSIGLIYILGMYLRGTDGWTDIQTEVANMT